MSGFNLLFLKVLYMINAYAFKFQPRTKFTLFKMYAEQCQTSNGITKQHMTCEPYLQAVLLAVVYF